MCLRQLHNFLNSCDDESGGREHPFLQDQNYDDYLKTELKGDSLTFNDNSLFSL